jgi:hypothetical protein
MRHVIRAMFGTALLAALGCGGPGFRGVPVSDQGISADEALERRQAASEARTAPAETNPMPASAPSSQPTSQPTTQPSSPAPPAP